MGAKFVRRWDSRLGEDAARYLFRSLMSVFVASSVGLLFIVITVGTRKAYPLVIIVASVLFVGAMLSFCVSLVLASRSLSNLYGQKISVLRMPPLKEDRFDAWCERNEINPPVR
jgi:hypothetical protein